MSSQLPVNPPTHQDVLSQISESVDRIQSLAPGPVQAGIVLGSGLGDFVSCLSDPVIIPYTDIPHFVPSAVEGHAGNLVIGTLKNADHGTSLRLACMQGRFHYYEGHSPQTVTFPIRVLRNLGIQSLVLTNAAGGINPEFKPGTLMIIEDHINLTGDNPLRGPHVDAFGSRFPDMSEAYSSALRKMLSTSAHEMGLPLAKGIYLGLSGPNYETPAEIRMARTLGADAVGMSTVYEAIVANQMGLHVAGLSCITNLAAGVSPHKLSHQDVMETASRVQQDFIQLLLRFYQQLALQPVSSRT